MAAQWWFRAEHRCRAGAAGAGCKTTSNAAPAWKDIRDEHHRWKCPPPGHEPPPLARAGCNRTAPAAAPHDPQAPKAAPAVTTLHYYSLAASAFAPDGLHTTTSDYFNQWNPSALSNTDSGRCFNAGLSLPDGARLKRVTIYYTASASAMFFEVNQQTLTTHTGTELVTLDTATATTPTYSSASTAFPAGTPVSMATNAYSAGVCPAPARPSPA